MATTQVNKTKILFRPPMAFVVRSAAEYDVDTIVWQSGNTIRYTLNGTPDLSVLSAGQNIRIKSAGNAVNNGQFEITAVDDTSDYIEVTNPDRTDGTADEASDSPAVAYEAEVFSRYVSVGDAVSMTPEPKTTEQELSDASELDDIVGIRGMLEYTFEELDQADLDAVNQRGAVFEVVTDKGGTNGTGKTFRMVNCDYIRMRPAEGWGSALAVKKVGLGTDLPTLLADLYTLSDNAA